MYLGIATLSWIWISSLSGAAPPVTPVQMSAIDLVFLAMLIAWAYWVDKNRAPVNKVSDPPPPSRAGYAD